MKLNKHRFVCAGARHKTMQDFGVAVLEISPVHLEDSGVYTCQITTEWGTADTSASLTVTGKTYAGHCVCINKVRKYDLLNCIDL